MEMEDELKQKQQSYILKVIFSVSNTPVVFCQGDHETCLKFGLKLIEVFKAEHQVHGPTGRGKLEFNVQYPNADTIMVYSQYVKNAMLNTRLYCTLKVEEKFVPSEFDVPEDKKFRKDYIKGRKQDEAHKYRINTEDTNWV